MTTKKTPTINRDDRGHYTSPHCEHTHEPHAPAESQPQPPVIAQVATGASHSLRVRSAPSLDGAELGLLEDGDKVEVTALEGAWATIVYEGATAYVMARYLNCWQESGK